MQKRILILVFLLVSIRTISQDNNLYEAQLFIQDTDTLRCRILTPVDFSPEKKYPLIVFLHGAGERGDDNESQLKWGGSFFTDSLTRVKYPAIVIFPQCPKDSSWSNTIIGEAKDSLGGFSSPAIKVPHKPMNLVLNFIDTLIANGKVDVHRIYVGGLSMGGFGTFEILWRRPDLFAAAFAICGGGNPEMVRSYAKKLPIWVFHGNADMVVPVANSRLMVKTLKEQNAEVRYTEYPGVGHESWKNAFSEPELIPWLFSKHKK